MPLRDTTGGYLPDSRQNKAAARMLSKARATLGMTQPDFSRAMAARLHVAEYTQPTITGWEQGERLVSAPVLLAALELLFEAGLASSLDEFVAPIWAPTGARWAEKGRESEDAWSPHVPRHSTHSTVAELNARPQGWAAILDILDSLEIPHDASDEELLEVARQIRSESTGQDE